MTLKEIAEKFEEEIVPSTKALIFDLDGTLVDSNTAHLAAWTEACVKFGLTYPKEKFFFYAGLPSTEIAADIIKNHPGISCNVDPLAVSQEKEIIFEKYQKEIKPIEPVVHILKKYKNSIPTALGTGRIKSSAMRTLEVLGLKDDFEAIVTADCVKNHKPAADTFLKCAELLNADPSFCLVFEDAERGLEAAVRAGMRVVDVRKLLGPERL